MSAYMVQKNRGRVVDEKIFFKDLASDAVRFLIYSPFGDLGQSLRLEPEIGINHMNGFCFEHIYTSGPYQVYRVWKAENGN
ncbi:MAG: hypothetical protein PHO30_02775 [Candidatus Omnitrophica bacterium]|nr:hypothetical protein [Candidatus Omnitrophota bacterium]